MNNNPPKKPYQSIAFEAMDVTKPYEFTVFGDMAVTKPCEFTCLFVGGVYCSRGGVAIGSQVRPARGIHETTVYLDPSISRPRVRTAGSRVERQLAHATTPGRPTLFASQPQGIAKFLCAMLDPPAGDTRCPFGSPCQACEKKPTQKQTQNRNAKFTQTRFEATMRIGFRD